MKRLVLAFLGALLPVLGASAQTAQPAGEPRREWGYITTAGGVKLAYVAYLPPNGRRFPAVIQYDPYVGGGNAPDPQFLKHGYVFIGVNVPGSGCSQGDLDFLGKAESAAGAEVVEWVARQPWSNGAVGLWGHSYPGHKAIQIAALRPPHLRAVVAGALTRSVRDDGYYPGGLLNTGLLSQWRPIMQPLLEAIGLKNRADWGDRDCAANIAARPAEHHVADVTARRDDAAWWNERALSRVIGDVRVPVMIEHNWQDQLLVSGDALFARLTGPRKLMLMNGGHSFSTVQPEVIEQTFRWFDRWLKGVRNGVDREPPITALWESTMADPRTINPARWQTSHTDWPLDAADRRTFALTADGTLSVTPAGDAAKASPRSFLAALGTEFIGSDAQFALVPDPSGVLAWRTPPLDAPLAILGAPELKLFVQATDADADLMIVLHEIYPDGATQYLQRAVLRVSALLGRRLTPGRAEALTIRLPSVGAALRRGHRLELQVMTPPTIASPAWAFEPLAASGRITILSDAAHPSALTLPLLRDAPAPPAALACGAMPMQPCRPAPAGR